jgi:glycerophosphoryl diester phosphodiesterase
MEPHPVFARLRALAVGGPVVVAHRGDSAHHPENTLAAFRSALTAGVAMQEFDVGSTRDRALVCLHDDCLDRTTNAARRLGPGALLAHTDAAVVRELDAGSWRGEAHAGERVPSLADVLALLQPRCIALVEHKGGEPEDYVAEVRRSGAAAHCIVQSFDWVFVARVHALAPDLALAVLGPVPGHARLDDAVVAAARRCGAGMVHWADRALAGADVARAHAAGLLVCTYTTDDELGWAGGTALGIDAMCTNDPAGMLAWRARAAAPAITAAARRADARQ